VVRIDFAVEAFRVTKDSELKRSTLLLLENLASHLPHLTLNSVMPIFTFMTENMGSQDDEGSFQMLQRAMYSLLPKLRTTVHQRGGSIAGMMGILITFNVAFEQFHPSRRVQIYQALIETLGPMEVLPVVMTLLMDKYPAEEDVKKQFIPTIWNLFDEKVAFEVTVSKSSLRC
jgi:hypothetical protein